MEAGATAAVSATVGVDEGVDTADVACSAVRAAMAVSAIVEGADVSVDVDVLDALRSLATPVVVER